jgi:hypothetical protein
MPQLAVLARPISRDGKQLLFLNSGAKLLENFSSDFSPGLFWFAAASVQ